MPILFEQPTEAKYAYKFRKDSKFIPLVIDDMFYTMLNNEKRKQYVATLISYCTDLKYEYIMDNIKFIKNTIDKENYHDSKKTVDLIVKINKKVYNIEMNNFPNIQALERNVDYANEIYRSPRQKGREYKFQQVIQINICNFKFKGNNTTMEEYYIQNENYILTDKIKFIFIYLPNIREKFYNKSRLTNIEKLMLTFNEGKYDNIKEVVKGSKIMEEYRKDAEEAAEIQELWERLAYDREAEQKALYQAELKRREEFGIKQKEKSDAIAFYKKGVSKEIICDALNIDSQQLEDILAENEDNTEK